MLPTPSTSHVSYDLIYEPAEDSYLFLDTLSSASETAWLRSRFSSQRQKTDETGPRTKRRRGRRKGVPLLVEIGPGSGVVVAFLTAQAETIFGSHVLSMGVDVNPHACLATQTTVEKALAETKARTVETTTTTTTTTVEGQVTNSPPATATATATGKCQDATSSVYLSSLNGDLASPLRPCEVDVLIFNPPYVPTESVPVAATITTASAITTGAVPLSSSSSSSSPHSSSSHNPAAPSFEEQSNLLALSYAGGVDGMEVTRRLLLQVPDVLSHWGVAYVLFCRGNRPEEVKSWIRAWQQRPLPPGDAPGEGEEEAPWQWRAETVGTSGKTAGWEKLEIVRIWRE
ncbi:uncharacterized protein Z519_03118 [Cladophialophora bantiana CBS 173.52]|uniref:Methyltransferase small domain-containing protein n=1 Tax=Cladophialophora bantiana (strain ATCC 10958 / CBS 173.52 / CDC B-1940 / NIH 8579) TaxID=1442370 RepID=A0A0D2GC35_CLAB1|nr:uncharacterized protein Z519_03118 [Cladophialophora bantiana CBS 173.52]KIW96052.1 hypothetical protein Z519_03118 [Cladophialophora bantiana CBS 173.52]